MGMYLKQLLIAIISLFFSLNISAQDGVDAYFYYSPFYAPGTGTYVETYLAFAGQSVYYIMDEDSLVHSSLEVTMLFKNADEIKEFRKYNVMSPMWPDTNEVFPSFIDLQRVIIPNGVYNFDLIIHDNYAPDSIEDFRMSKIMSVNIPSNQLAFGGIEFLESYEIAEEDNIFVKSGFECIPYVSDFFPVEVTELNLYTEIYGIAKELGPLEDFLVMFHIENSNTSKPIKNYSFFQKHQAKNVNVFFKTIDITNLPTGNYHLVVEVRNRKNELVSSNKRFFQRSNPGVEHKKYDITEIDVQETFVTTFTNVDSLAFFMKALRPISDVSENRFIDNQLQASNLKLMQQFFYNFWLKRNETNPEFAWGEYKFKLDEVEQKFGSRMIPGFASERGRVYLQYGAPNSIITERNEQGAYPYEIWHYYKIADLTDKKFIFYNNTLTSSDYILLHSNMIGETNNPDWEDELYSRGGHASPGKAREYFEGN